MLFSDDFGIRLMNHDAVVKTAGRVEILYNGVWGTVCNKYGDSLQADILCKQKGFIDGTAVSVIPKRYGNTTAPIYLKNVNCTSDEKLFLGCPNAGWLEVSNCTHDDDLEVLCYSKGNYILNVFQLCTNYNYINVRLGETYCLITFQSLNSKGAEWLRGFIFTSNF